MKANELRIGNWVSYNGHPIMVRGTAEIGNAIYLRDIIYPINDSIQGIPLTPEILEKAGFEKRGNSNGIFIAYDINEIYRVYLEKGKYSLWILDRDYEEVSYCRLSDITNLHQLQNLYYCLCGQELNIEL